MINNFNAEFTQTGQRNPDIYGNLQYWVDFRVSERLSLWFNSLTRLYFFVALNMYVLEL